MGVTARHHRTPVPTTRPGITHKGRAGRPDEQVERARDCLGSCVTCPRWKWRGSSARWSGGRCPSGRPRVCTRAPAATSSSSGRSAHPPRRRSPLRPGAPERARGDRCAAGPACGRDGQAPRAAAIVGREFRAAMVAGMVDAAVLACLAALDEAASGSVYARPGRSPGQTFGRLGVMYYRILTLPGRAGEDELARGLRLADGRPGSTPATATTPPSVPSGRHCRSGARAAGDPTAVRTQARLFLFQS